MVKSLIYIPLVALNKLVHFVLIRKSRLIQQDFKDVITCSILGIFIAHICNLQLLYLLYFFLVYFAKQN